MFTTLDENRGMVSVVLGLLPLAIWLDGTPFPSRLLAYLPLLMTVFVCFFSARKFHDGSAPAESEERKWWGVMLCVVLSVICIDYVRYLIAPAASVSFIGFPPDSRNPLNTPPDNGTKNERYYPTPRNRDLSWMNTSYQSINDIHGTAQQAEYIQQFEKALSLIDAEQPVEWYSASKRFENGMGLGEHFRFSIRKGWQEKTIRLVDVQIVVDKFLPPMPVGAAAEALNPIPVIIVDIWQKPEPLPWVFNATWYIDDYVRGQLVPFESGTVDIEDEAEHDFYVKVMARTPGIYAYHANVRVRGAAGKTETIPIFKDDRTIYFSQQLEDAPEWALQWFEKQSDGPAAPMPPSREEKAPAPASPKAAVDPSA